MSSNAVQPINNFETNSNPRRVRDVAESRTSRGRRPISVAKAAVREVVRPTPERMAKPDAPIKTGPGHYVVESGLDRLRKEFRPLPSPQAEAVLERLHHRCSLDHDPGMNERMFEAGKRYEELAHVAGLAGIGAQNLLAARGAGDPANMIPVSEGAARARSELRKAWVVMGSKVAGAVHGMLVEGKDAVSVGRETSSYKSERECGTAGLTTLRIGLWMLVNARWA